MLDEESWQGNVNIVHLKYTETITLEELFQVFAARMYGLTRHARYLHMERGAIFDLLPVVFVSEHYDFNGSGDIVAYDVILNTGSRVTFLEPNPDVITTRPYPRYKHSEFIEKWLGLKQEQKESVNVNVAAKNLLDYLDGLQNQEQGETK